jgi:hypothetical protein
MRVGAYVIFGAMDADGTVLHAEETVEGTVVLC